MAAAIKSGYYEIGLAGGVETMSSTPMAMDGDPNPRWATNADAKSCLLPMGITSENVAAKFGVDRVGGWGRMGPTGWGRASKRRVGWCWYSAVRSQLFVVALCCQCFHGASLPRNRAHRLVSRSNHSPLLRFCPTVIMVV